jgi:hypothetical protein
MTPAGQRGSDFAASNGIEAKEIAKQDFGETVLDFMDGQDEDGSPVVFAIVSD